MTKTVTKYSYENNSNNNNIDVRKLLWERLGPSKFRLKYYEIMIYGLQCLQSRKKVFKNYFQQDLTFFNVCASTNPFTTEIQLNNI